MKVIKNLLWFVSNRSYSRVMANPQISMCRQYNISSINAIQKRAVKNRWRWWPTKMSWLYYDYQVFQHFCKWDINYIPAPLFDPYLLRCLNPVTKSRTYEDKAMMWNVFSCVRQPYSPMKMINGVYYNSSNEVASLDDCFKAFTEGRDYIIKPVEETCGGNGVVKFRFDSSSILMPIIEKYKSGFVIQESLAQSDVTAQLNPKSLNTIRVTTLNINGKSSVCNVCLRCGAADSVVDNVAMGGSIVKVNFDGTLAEFGYSKQGKVTRSGNVLFKDITIPNIDKVIELAFYAHSQIPTCGIVGWDIALDNENLPVLIEANVSGPGILYEQMCCGPLFSERTEEVVNYCIRSFAHKKEEVGHHMLMDY